MSGTINGGLGVGSAGSVHHTVSGLEGPQLRRSNRLRKASKFANTTDTDDSPEEITPSVPQPTLPAAGPSWDENEVNIFYNGYRQYGPAWKKIAGELRNRTPAMVEALFENNKGYLSLSSQHTSALTLYTIVKDQYQSLLRIADGVQPAVHQAPSTTAAAAASVSISSKRIMASPKPTSASKRSVHAGSSSKPEKSPRKGLTAVETKRSRKRKLFPDSPPSLTERARKRTVSSTASRRTVSSPVREKEAEEADWEEDEEREGDAEERKSAQKRKSGVEHLNRQPVTRRRAASVGSVLQPPDVLPPKLRDKRERGKSGFSPAPAPAHNAVPLSPAPMYPDSGIHTQPSGKTTPARDLKRKRRGTEVVDWAQTALNRFVRGSKGARWCCYEWFYPDIDRPFFEHNDFEQCLTEMALPKVKRLTRAEWSHIRGLMGKPRRFSHTFLQSERSKLEHFRANIREQRNGKSPISRPFHPPLHEIPIQLPIGTRVLGWIHEGSETNPRLHVGIVQGVRYSQYLVHFEARLQEDESHSFEVWLDDTQIAEHSAITAPPTHSPCTPTRPSLLLEVRVMTRLLRLLNEKDKLISEFRLMNNEAQNMLVGFPEDFQRQYALLVVRLCNLNEELQPALTFLHNPPLALAQSPLSPGAYGSWSTGPNNSVVNSSSANEGGMWPPASALLEVAERAIKSQDEDLSPPDLVTSLSSETILLQNNNPCGNANRSTSTANAIISPAPASSPPIVAVGDKVHNASVSSSDKGVCDALHSPDPDHSLANKGWSSSLPITTELPITTTSSPDSGEVSPSPPLSSVAPTAPTSEVYIASAAQNQNQRQESENEQRTIVLNNNVDTAPPAPPATTTTTTASDSVVGSALIATTTAREDPMQHKGPDSQFPTDDRDE